MAASVGVALLLLTVNTKVLAAESTVPSFALMVIVEVPVQLVAGVSVSVAPDILGVTCEAEEVAVKVCESPLSASVSDR